ncbi:GMC family oxidoreductase N-terminal domain-containing protein [Streptomyces sp. ISL-44]|uniref:GMC family oxidoreductase n=1 Tax=Streptomyces sp. ISL-44 TaxID=2819184 RepID=UPI001BE78A74|nr:GMC oxidoreductase [Streptomyces sp. ISL-44]MBT2543134.1 GMC family oxidoreductase N-terminal domain-containing protein [Streptomyces sp. ISL-44]
MTPESGAPPAETGFDYIVVGAGAGGGPLAANLAAAGMRVLLLDAGGAEDNDNYLVPAFHADASEDPVQRWDYFVRHYADEQQHQRDSKLVPGEGILYPRAGTVGGCTAHHALITVYPYNRDWDEIARETGDASWGSTAMRWYFERLERCTYRPRPKEPPGNRLLAALLELLPFAAARYRNDSRHGFDGWLPTDLADPELVIQDKQLLAVILSAAQDTLADFIGRPLSPLEGLGSFVDPNDWRVQTEGLQGLWQIPISTADGRRSAARERVRAVQRSHPDNLIVRTNALVTRVVLDEDGAATGVDYVDQPHAYRADPGTHDGLALPVPRRALATREVVLAAGAFNTPQLLMLSGIGPREELERHGIPVRVPLRGVGANLQDRYEIGVVSQMDREFPVIKDCDFHAPEPGAEPDRCYRAWQLGEGLYTTNGAVVGITRKSRPSLDAPDLFIFGGPFDFRGYYPGYSRDLTSHRDRFTWAILKSRTHNTNGRVRLRSADPRDTPLVNFHYFTEGTDEEALDLDAMASAVKFVRSMNRSAASVIRKELWPGEEVGDTESVRRFVQDEAWGHHASCSCRMGRADDPSAVVDSRFRVRGVERLRIVDASVFPRIPGFFIAVPIYMISEKASDVILRDASRKRTAGAASRHPT